MMTLGCVVSLIDNLGNSILDESGEVFFCSKRSFRENNHVAFVGLNPGGTGLPTIRENLRQYSEDESKEEGFSGFLDQCWHEPFFSKNQMCPKCTESVRKNDVVHQDNHQRRVSLLADSLNIDLRKSLAFNAIWRQTRTAKELESTTIAAGRRNLGTLFSSKYFPIISEIFVGCDIRLVVCLGNGVDSSSFSFFQKAYKENASHIETIQGNYRNGKIFEVVKNGRKIIFFGIPHPSRFQLGEIGLSRLIKLAFESNI